MQTIHVGILPADVPAESW